MPQERGLYGEETAQQIDAEIKRIVTDAHNTARRILIANRDHLEVVTKRLLEIEVMEGDELRQLLGLPAAAPEPQTGRTPLPAADQPATPPVSS
jgi:cell division protease FtsH